jgi:hypothetical protein
MNLTDQFYKEQLKESKRLDTSNGLLLTTMVMALGAITFSALTMAFDRSHHHKSVRPFCNIHQNITETEIRISIENPGMGPMLIISILLLKNLDDPIENGAPLTKATFSPCNCDVFIPNTDSYVLASCSTLDLFHSVTDISGNRDQTLLKDKLNGRCLCVRYADIYDDTYEKKTILTI